MKKRTIFVAAALAIAIFSCKESNHQHDTEVHVMDEHQADSQKLQVTVDNAKDPVCEMSTADHLSDTIQYEGKVYGFCSTQCKEDFAKDPAQYLSKLN